MTYTTNTLSPLFREHLLVALKNPLAKGFKDFLVSPVFTGRGGCLGFRTNPQSNADKSLLLFEMFGDYIAHDYTPCGYMIGTEEKDAIIPKFNARILSDALEMLPNGLDIQVHFPNEKYGTSHIFEHGQLTVIVMPICLN